MLRSVVRGADNSGLRLLRVFFVYRWGLGHRGEVGFYVFASIRKYRLPTARLRIRRSLKKGQRVRGVILSTRAWRCNLDGSGLRAWNNRVLPLRFRLVPRGSHAKGPCFRGVRRPRVLGWLPAVV